jgi:hypothetical protein
MLEVLFWVYAASAAIVFLYLFVFAHLAMKHFSKECNAQGMVKTKTSTNWAKVSISLLQCVLMIGLPIINTFIAIVWLCSTEKVMELWEEKTWEMYCYPDELP